MSRRRLLLILLGLAALPRTLAAGTAPTRPQVLLIECPSRESLRASLLAYADSVRATEPLDAGEALYLAGVSCGRASLLDGAIACFQRADSVRGDDEERLALADALLLRRRDGDIEAALALLEQAVRQAPLEVSAAAGAYQARLAWAELLAGHAPRSFELFTPIEKSLDLDPVWGYRMARAFLEAGDRKRALAALQPLAIGCREQDEEIMDLAERAFAPFGNRARLEEALRRTIVTRDQSEGKLSEVMGGRRVRFTAPDGAALGGVLAPAAGEKHPRAAVVLWAPRDTLESYDSLTVALTRDGWAVLLMEPRGSGWSAGPACPFPEAWNGREDAMQTTCAHDVREGLRALSIAAHADTSRWLLVGVGPTAPIAVEAAELDSRVQALLLLSPAPAPVDRGWMRERIRRLHRPIYFASAPEDFLQFEVTDALYQAGDRARSRVADVAGPGSGARPFRRDRAAVRRLITWLHDTFPARATSVPRPGAQRSR